MFGSIFPKWLYDSCAVACCFRSGTGIMKLFKRRKVLASHDLFQNLHTHHVSCVYWKWSLIGLLNAHEFILDRDWLPWDLSQGISMMLNWYLMSVLWWTSLSLSRREIWHLFNRLRCTFPQHDNFSGSWRQLPSLFRLCYFYDRRTYAIMASYKRSVITTCG